MRNCFFAITVLFVAGAGLTACSDDDGSSSPLQPSPLAPAPAGGQPAGFAGGPSASPAGLTAGADAAGGGIAQLAPPPDEFNAYNAQIEYVDGEVTITFVPVDMPRMPAAAGAHRNRAVAVRHCPVEPHHVGQRCGEPVFEDSFAFMGSPSRTFTLPECGGWLVVEAAELSTDRYNGWRNAPLSCRTDEEGRTVASVDTDGNGDGWGSSQFDPPARASDSESEPEPEPEPDPMNGAPTITSPGDKRYVRGQTITAFSIAVRDPDDDDVTVGVTGLPSGLSWSAGRVSGRVAMTAELQDYTVTVTANDGVNAAVTGTFTITVAENVAPEITVSNRTYRQGQTIEAFSVASHPDEGDTVVITVRGLPESLSASPDGEVSGTVEADADAEAYTVTVTANDGVNAAVTGTFTITVTENTAPEFTVPETAPVYVAGQSVPTESPVSVSDPEEDDLTVRATGLPAGLTVSPTTGALSGTVAADAEARTYTVTVTASDGLLEGEETFDITVRANAAPVISVCAPCQPGANDPYAYSVGTTITPETITATDEDSDPDDMNGESFDSVPDTVTLEVTGLPQGLTWTPGTGPTGQITGTTTNSITTVTVTVRDGVNEPVTDTFRIGGQ